MIRTIQLPLGVCKAGRTRAHLGELHGMDIPDKFVPEYIDFATKDEVENCDIRRMLTVYGPKADRKLLQKIQGKVLFAIEGYDDTPEELIEIPEVRRYFRFAFEKWPHWLFTGSIFTPNLMAIAFACLPDVTILRSAEALQVQYKSDDMQEFLQKALASAAWLHHRIGTGKRKGLIQLRTAAAYLGLEF